MSKAVPMRPRQAPKSGHAFAIVASHYNVEFVQPLLDHAVAELAALEPAAPVIISWAPGAFEIPVVVKTLADSHRCHAVIALGVILRGATSHADLIAEAVTSALTRISLDTGVPVIHEVLLLDNEGQARERCVEPTLNRGTEAARAAVSIVRTLDEIRQN
jgi:6,7-dimethyl-8-ribityllumazine synthase